MSSIKNDIIGSFNQLLKEQKSEPGNARFSLVTFNHEVSFVYDFNELESIPELTDENYICSGYTALYDAIGMSIDRLGRNLSALDESERPNKVLVIILTDGEENRSSEYTQSRISEMIQHQKDVYSWQFIFLAANQDACLTANSIGISSGNAMYFNSSGESAKKSFGNISKYMSRTRLMSDIDYQATLDSALLDDEKDARDDNSK
jgi:uncharacterized protein YegL